MIKIINATNKPLSLMGEVASRCWNSKPSPRIGIECIEAEHGRVLEYADVTVEISEYSARVMRELYTHIIGTSRLQESTRYVKYNDFKYYTPPELKDENLRIYQETMEIIAQNYKFLVENGVSKQDAGNLLPLGTHSKMILKINARALLNMAKVRLCNRALLEYRILMRELLKEISEIDEEWKKIIEYAKPKCYFTKCTEKHPCGLQDKIKGV
jgi:thymidylate synthase (FAD)